MEQETLKALEESIEHWERLANGTSASDETIGSSSCALCILAERKSEQFMDAYERDPTPVSSDPVSRETFHQVYRGCYGCPVLAHTGKTSCVGTPWDEVSNVVSRAKGGDFTGACNQAKPLPEFKEAALKQLEFLKSLLPKEAA